MNITDVVVEEIWGQQRSPDQEDLLAEARRWQALLWCGDGSAGRPLADMRKKLLKKQKKWLLWRIFVFSNLVIIKKLNLKNEAGNSGMPLSANLLKLESSILPRAKRASSETT